MKYFFQLLCLLTFISCTKENIQSGPETNCVGDINWNYTILVCSDDPTPPGNWLCRIDSFGNYTILDSSKLFIPQYCQDSGTIINYINGQGEIHSYFISEKSYLKRTAVFNTFTKCQMNDNKDIGYCINTEEITLSMELMDSNHKIVIQIMTKPDVINPKIGRAGDFLTIYTFQTKNGASIDFNSVINKRTLSYEFEYNQEFYPTVELLNIKFNDVISNDVTTIGQPTYKYYYNIHKGLVAFVDTNGVLWRIEQ